jgi:hypothetical protein
MNSFRIAGFLAAALVAAAQPFPPAANVVPADKSTAVPLNARIIVGLTYTNQYTANPVKLLQGTTSVAGTTALSTFPSNISGVYPIYQFVKFTPAAPLQPNTPYTIEVDAFNAPAFSSTFTTGTTISTTPLALVSSDPPAGAMFADRSKPMTLRFNNPIDPGSFPSNPFILHDLTAGYTWGVSCGEPQA